MPPQLDDQTGSIAPKHGKTDCRLAQQADEIPARLEPSKGSVSRSQEKPAKR
jgi:hypothetical protein